MNNLNQEQSFSVQQSGGANASLVHASEETLKLEGFIKKCIQGRLKKSAIIDLAAQCGIDYTYASLIRKIYDYKKNGINAIRKKDRKDKAVPRSFHPEFLRKLTEIYTSGIIGGVAVRAYEDAHKHFRSIAHHFVTLQGEELSVVNGNLCDVKNQQIVSTSSSLFEAGIYIINGQEYPVGSYESARRYLSGIRREKAEALFLNRFGVHDFRNKRQHTMKINYSNLEPNYLIVGDGKKLDLIVITEDWRRISRPWLFGWYDMATRRYCYELAWSETSEAIANSLAVAVNNWGIPKVCKHDNGKAYLSGRFQAMKDNLNIETVTATVKLARAKPIESFHNIIDQLLKTQIGYTGNKYQEMPADTKERLKRVAGLQRDIKRAEFSFKQNDDYMLTISENPEARLKNSKKRFMHVSELRSLLNDVFSKYHTRTHGGLVADKLGRLVSDITCTDESISQDINTPNGRYDYYVKKGFAPVQADPAVIAVYAMNFELRTVQLKTGISLFNEEYYSPKLAKYAGEKVLIRFTSYSPEKVYVFAGTELGKIKDKSQLTPEIYRNLDFICIAERVKLLDYGDIAYKEHLHVQRQEEYLHKSAFKKDSNNDYKIHSLTGIEKQIPKIRDAEQDYEVSQLKKNIPLKKLKDIFDE